MVCSCYQPLVFWLCSLPLPLYPPVLSPLNWNIYSEYLFIQLSNQSFEPLKSSAESLFANSLAFSEIKMFFVWDWQNHCYASLSACQICRHFLILSPTVDFSILNFSLKYFDEKLKIIKCFESSPKPTLYLWVIVQYCNV